MCCPEFLQFQVCLPLNSCYIGQGQYFFCFLGTLLSLSIAPKICSNNGCETGVIQCEQQKICIFPWNIWLLQIFISVIPWQKSVTLRLLTSLFSTSRADNQGVQGNGNGLCFPLSSHPQTKGWSAIFQSQQGKNLDSSTFEVAVEVSVAVRSLSFDVVCPGTFQDIACSAGCQAVFGVIVPWDSVPLTSRTCGCDFEIKCILLDRACAPADLLASNFEL